MARPVLARAPRRRTILLTMPNIITLARLLAVPPIVWLSTSQAPAALVGAALLFLAACASDWLDGHLARRLDASTTLGRLMDPVADKVLVLSVLFVFVQRGLLPLWLPLVNMFREFVVSAWRQDLTAQGEVVMANWMGKTKFALQATVVGLGYLHLLFQSAGSELPGGQQVIFWAALVVTVVSFAFLLNFARWHQHFLCTKEPPCAKGPQ